jgi:hypothetical protein
MLRFWMRRLVPLLALLTPTVATAGSPSSPSAQCEAAIDNAEKASHLPRRLLGAIAEVESGRLDDAGKLRPWPWTINAAAAGQFFATKQEAIDAVRVLQAQGVQSIDVGCMQVNLMQHPDAFASLDEGFDPAANTVYAARFLRALYSMSRSWSQATGAYHSQTPAIGADYEQRVMARWQHVEPPFGVGSVQPGYLDLSSSFQNYRGLAYQIPGWSIDSVLNYRALDGELALRRSEIGPRASGHKLRSTAPYFVVKAKRPSKIALQNYSSVRFTESPRRMMARAAR